MSNTKPINITLNAEGNSHFIPTPLLFLHKYGQWPSSLHINNFFDIDKLLAFITEKYSLTEKENIASYLYSKQKKLTIKDGLFFLKEGLALRLNIDRSQVEMEYEESWFEIYEGEEPAFVPKSKDHFKLGIGIYYDGTLLLKGEAEELLKELHKFQVEPKKKSELHFLCTEGNNLALRALDLKAPSMDIALNYGVTFKELYDYTFDKLVGEENSNKGLVLLYGVPGSGKTFLLKQLINDLSEKKKVIYLPPDMAGELSNPKFLPFLMEHQNSILIIEDGENVIKSRKGGQNQAVSNLLNIADGLLSDALNIQIVCTFNCSLNDVDEALLRKGRLIAKHEFKALKKEEAQKLLDHLKKDFIAKGDMTLAEIYNCEDKDFIEKQNSIGFNI